MRRRLRGGDAARRPEPRERAVATKGRFRPAGVGPVEADQSAREYVNRLLETELIGLRAKPVDRNEGNPVFFEEMYQILNLLRTMCLPVGARVLDGGCGAGWVTELLALLGFEVDALDPSEDMLHVARDRTHEALTAHRLAPPAHIVFHQASLETCPIPDASIDGIVLHEALHHVVDERQALAHCLRVLRPGGVLGVSGETNWQPGNREQEAFFAEETARFGTYESPFAFEYLESVLHDVGFAQVVRYHGMAGLFPIELGHLPLAAVAEFPAQAYNTVIAAKGGASVPNTAGPAHVAAGAIQVLDWARAGTDAISIRVRLLNTGTVAWLHRPAGPGQVTLAARAEDAEGVFELGPRVALPESVRPDDSLELTATLAFPEARWPQRCALHLVCEHLYWFSDRGSPPAVLEFDE